MLELEVEMYNDADEPKPRQNDLQLVRFNAYSQDADDNDDLMNPTTPITSVRSVSVYEFFFSRSYITQCDRLFNQ